MDDKFYYMDKFPNAYQDGVSLLDGGYLLTYPIKYANV